MTTLLSLAPSSPLSQLQPCGAGNVSDEEHTDLHQVKGGMQESSLFSTLEEHKPVTVYVPGLNIQKPLSVFVDDRTRTIRS